MARSTVNPGRSDPNEGFGFRARWDGSDVAGVTEVGALTRRTEVIEHREGGDPSTSRRPAGRTAFDPITLCGWVPITRSDGGMLGGVRSALLLDLAGPLAEPVAIAQAAEAAGVDAVYAIEGGREAFVPLAAMAVATSRIGLGSYVVNAYARSPWLTAVSALDLDELSGGRFVLGLGTGNRHINDWSHGLDSSRPLAKIREYVPIVRAVVAARAGDLVELDGDVHRTRWRAGRDPVRPALPVVVAAAGPKMIELAGSLADGVGVGVLVSPEHLREVIRPRACDAAAAAGRDPGSLTFPMAAMVSVDQDEERARATTRHAICRLFHPVPHPYYDFLLHAQGFAAAADAAAELVPQGRVREAMTHIDDEIVDRLTITGTPAVCAARLAAYDGLADEVICLDLRRADPAHPIAPLGRHVRDARPALRTRTSVSDGRCRTRCPRDRPSSLQRSRRWRRRGRAGHRERRAVRSRPPASPTWRSRCIRFLPVLGSGTAWISMTAPGWPSGGTRTSYWATGSTRR